MKFRANAYYEEFVCNMLLVHYFKICDAIVVDIYYWLGKVNNVIVNKIDKTVELLEDERSREIIKKE